MPSDAYTFELAWRWTQSTHNVLPPDVMEQIRPLERCSVPVGQLPTGELDQSLFEDVRSARTEGPRDEGPVWLRQLPVAQSERVVVRWAECTAIETTWEVFVQYWDDFCYPNEDVEVFPPSGSWLLLYRHYEALVWGRRPGRGPGY